MMTSATYQSPCGRLTLFATDEGITRIEFPAVRISSDIPRPSSATPVSAASSQGACGEVSPSGASQPRPGAHGILDQAIRELELYFQGRLTEFAVPVSLTGTPFQLDVWRAMLAVPYGKTATYGELAAAIGRPTAFRAVGMACHANPVPILLPCHRIVGKDGALTGYASGLDFKRHLLALEASQAKAD